jgi:hypothetical protein
MHGAAPKYTSIHEIKITSGEIKKWVKKAIDDGWMVEKKKDNHLLVINPENNSRVTLTTTRVEGRTLLNYRAQLRRAGLKDI